MAFRIFYAWQSDLPRGIGKDLIQQALVDTSELLNADVEIQAAVRGIEVDHDTRNVPGSPAIAETIFGKIKQSDAFIADLTLVQSGGADRKAPNPNVLIEYGYALHALDDRRIIGVFNEAFGDPNDLPFDIRHRRWPIRYRADAEQRSDRARLREIRRALASKMAHAIRSVIAELGTAASPEERPAIEPGRRSTDQFPWTGGFVRHTGGFVGHNGDRRMAFPEGPSLYMRLQPRIGAPHMDQARTLQVVSDGLQTLGYYYFNGMSSGRGRHGTVVFKASPDDSSRALAASMLARNGGLHGVNCYHLGLHGPEVEAEPYILTTLIEEILTDGLENFLTVAEDGLGLEPPLDLSVGWEGIENFHLAVDHAYFHHTWVGPILLERIDEHLVVDSYSRDPFDLLHPFFERIYDEAGSSRPESRTVGQAERQGRSKKRGTGRE
ncbi:MAG: hypothetical protein OXJ64_16695 [Boseongicola sp.]|nr:hypothetical protein [Boseongicola sp.]